MANYKSRVSQRKGVGRVFTLALFSFVSIPGCIAAQLSLTPSVPQVMPGGSVSVELGVSGLTDPPALGAYDITVAFDGGLFALNSVAFGDPTLGNQLDLEGFGSVKTERSSTGQVELVEISLDDPAVLDSTQASSFILASLDFKALTEGTGTFTTSQILLSDSIGNTIPNVSGAITTVDVAGPITTAPEPGTLDMLLGTSLALGFFFRRSEGFRTRNTSAKS